MPQGLWIPGLRLTAHPGMTEKDDAPPRSRGTPCPSSAKSSAPENRGRRRPSREGAGDPKRDAGKTGCALHPRSRVQRQRRRRTRAYRFSGSNPAFPAQWFYDLFRALPGDRLSCHRRRCDAKHHHQLDASIEASGPHDFAVRISAVRLAALSRPSLPAPNVRDDRDTPLLRARDDTI